MTITRVASSKKVIVKTKKNRPHQLKYKKISLAERARLVNLVIDEGMSLRDVSKNLEINFQTAKSIIKRYRETGQISIHNRYRNISARLDDAFNPFGVQSQ